MPWRGGRRRQSGGFVTDGRRRRLWPRYPLRAVVTAQIAAVACVAIGTAVGLIYWQTALFASTLAVALLVPWRRRPLVEWCGTLLPRHRGNRLEERRHTDFRSPDGTLVGLIWTAGTVCAVAELLPDPGTVTTIGRDTTEDGIRIPLQFLADSLIQQDISLSGIDVIGHGQRMDPTAPAARAYDQLVGPLAATARRTVWLVVRFDITDQCDAVTRRGGGETGAARAISIATQRISRSLAATSTPVRILTANEIATVRERIRDTAEPDRATHPASDDECGTGYVVDPRVIGDRLDDLWAIRSHATTVTLRLRPAASTAEVRIALSCRLTTDVFPRPLHPGLVPTAGHDTDVLRSHLPGADPDLDALTEFAAVTREHLDTLAVDAGGCGQLIGSDDTGRAVAVRMVGPDIPRVSIHGEPYLVRQIVLRAIATGERIAVHTVDPQSWQSLIGTVADPGRLRLVDAAIRCGDATAVLFDGTDTVSLPDMITAIAVRETPLADDQPGLSIDNSTVSLLQPGAVGSRIHLWSKGVRSELSLVTIPAETAFIGTARAARVPSSAR